MSTLQSLSMAKMWLGLAIGKDKLADFAIGLSPYSEGRPTPDGFVQPDLAPNLEALYEYSRDHAGEDTGKNVEKAVLRMIEEKGKSDVVIYHSLVFLTTQLSNEKDKTAGFSIDCVAVAEAISGQVKLNQVVFKARSMNFGKSVWPEIEYYDSYISDNFGIHIL